MFHYVFCSYCGQNRANRSYYMTRVRNFTQLNILFLVPEILNC
jgi:hypothetical protein